MNNFNDNKFQELTDNELTIVEGGSIAVGLAIFASGMGIFMAGRAIGQDIKRRWP
jgi:lactobin A/cerein 7B family class IIb bacteriocin